MALPNLLVWMERGQERFVQHTARAAGVAIAAVGGPSVSAIGGMAHALDAEGVTDLRRALLRDDVDVIWIAAPERLEAAQLARLRQDDRPIVTSEPYPPPKAGGHADGSHDGGTGGEASGTLHRLLAFRAADHWTRVREALAAFGPVQSLTIESVGPRAAGTLFARLYDACDMLAHLAGRAAEVDAVASGPLPEPAESLPLMHGHLSAVVRFASNQAATIIASDCAPVWHRRIRALGPPGALIANDTDVWTIDDTSEPVAPAPAGAALLAGRQIARLVNDAPPASDERHADWVMTLCEACRLSARSQSAVQPERVGRMARE